jgi:chromosomal replication initiation ATPase DnaA
MQEQLVDFCAFLEKEGVTIQNQGDVIERFIFQFDKKRIIVGIVAAKFGLSPADLGKNIRDRNILEPRQIAMTLMMKYRIDSGTGIGRYFRDGQHVFDHTTVLHAKKVIGNLVETDQVFRAKYQAIENEVKKLLNIE